MAAKAKIALKCLNMLLIALFFMLQFILGTLLLSFESFRRDKNYTSELLSRIPLHATSKRKSFHLYLCN